MVCSSIAVIEKFRHWLYFIGTQGMVNDDSLCISKNSAFFLQHIYASINTLELSKTTSVLMNLTFIYFFINIYCLWVYFTYGKLMLVGIQREATSVKLILLAFLVRVILATDVSVSSFDPFPNILRFLKAYILFCVGYVKQMLSSSRIRSRISKKKAANYIPFGFLNLLYNKIRFELK